MSQVAVASFYRFVDLDDPARLRAALQAECERLELLGTILLAREGVNGTVAGRAGHIDALTHWLDTELALEPSLEPRRTQASEAPFRRLRVRVRKEIVTLGRPDIRPQAGTGRHVSPQEWNRLIRDPDTLVIDARNRYEIEVGTFPDAIDPGTDSFREFPDFVAGLSPADRRRPVAMFCTGGIRCEKASALMLEAGFENVSQLSGGILNYLESIPGEDNCWQGECFVFDTRVAVDRDLSEGGYVQCHACRRPLGRDDLASPDYREGVSCPKCIDETDTERRERLEERRRQVRLARARGAEHIGAGPPERKS
ncbi:MAG: rhodanese-related sulfurtransferase [Woeseiaceae bacterium]|nr:rhodanese-related sulfurtransferase [Woeseiaceae bacterium]